MLNSTNLGPRSAEARTDEIDCNQLGTFCKWLYCLRAIPNVEYAVYEKVRKEKGDETEMVLIRTYKRRSPVFNYSEYYHPHLHSQLPARRRTRTPSTRFVAISI